MTFDDDVYPPADIELKQLNYIDVKANTTIVKDNYDILLQNCVPRPWTGYIHRQKVKKGRRPWSIPISLFRDFIPDTEVNIVFITL